MTIWTGRYGCWFLTGVIVSLSLTAFAATRETVATDSPGVALELTVADAIGPAISDYIIRGLEKARQMNDRLVIIKLDTPGGLDASMREINQAIIDSSVPVVTYVHPAGARAASAGTYILYASHIAAMTPGTNLGAATPVQLGGALLGQDPVDRRSDKTSARTSTDKVKENASATDEKSADDAMSRKRINDAVAYIRSLAELRGRNADWAELAVREAASLSAGEAKARNVIDVIAADREELLTLIDSRTVMVGGQTLTLHTEDLSVQTFDQDWRTELLSIITNPNIVYLLMLLGFYGLIFELANPGYVLPGVVGAICLILALYAVQILPVNYAGVALILVGLAFMAGEMFMPSFGALGIGGLIAFVIGSVILFDVDRPGQDISLWLVGGAAALSGLFIMAAVGLLIRSHRRRVVSGGEAMIGSLGRALEDFQDAGRVFVHGETWRGHTRTPLRAGDNVRVTGRQGLLLEVEPCKNGES